jgi:ATP-dependent helicase/nuclease subunit A
VLSRGKGAIGDLERYLNNEGIPAYGENTGGYFESVEIQVFINLLKIVDNTRQDIPLISAMRCPVFGFSTAELAEIRISHRDGSFYDAVINYKDYGKDDELRTKVETMMDRILYWKEVKQTVTLGEFVRRLMYDTGYYDYCSGLPVGNQRTSNLRMLLEKAESFEEGNYSGLYGFLIYVEAMSNSNISVGEAKNISDNSDVVNVMTVHKSKGLEFPVVILMGAGKEIKFRGIGSPAAMHKDLGICLLNVNREEKWHRKTLMHRVIESKGDEKCQSSANTA